MIDEGRVYTRDRSFRAVAEAQARAYRVKRLKLEACDTYGHLLTSGDADRGYNFLPSLRNEILEAVRRRNGLGKGVDFRRTSANMLSSQAMCFNLFVPLNIDKEVATRLFDFLIGGVKAIREDIQIEYTPCGFVFGDQSGKGGVDCDALVQYVGKDGKSGLVVVETKYVEPEFSICGFRKSSQRDPCPVDTKVETDFSNCRYQSKKRYKYWKVADESGLFDTEKLHHLPCPFGGPLWQLWTNISLAYAIARGQGLSEFHYAVICPKGNAKLSNNGQVFDLFRSLLLNSEVFKVIYLEDIREALMGQSRFPKADPWITEFFERYLPTASV